MRYDRSCRVEGLAVGEADERSLDKLGTTVGDGRAPMRWHVGKLICTRYGIGNDATMSWNSGNVSPGSRRRSSFERFLHFLFPISARIVDRRGSVGLIDARSILLR